MSAPCYPHGRPPCRSFLGQRTASCAVCCPRKPEGAVRDLVRLDVMGESMGVAVDLGAVVVAVFMDEVDVEQELPVGEDLRRCAFADDAMLLGEDEATIGEQV